MLALHRCYLTRKTDRNPFCTSPPASLPYPSIFCLASINFVFLASGLWNIRSILLPMQSSKLLLMGQSNRCLFSHIRQKSRNLASFWKIPAWDPFGKVSQRTPGPNCIILWYQSSLKVSLEEKVRSLGPVCQEHWSFARGLSHFLLDLGILLNGAWEHLTALHIRPLLTIKNRSLLNKQMTTRQNYCQKNWAIVEIDLPRLNKEKSWSYNSYFSNVRCAQH